MTSLRGTVRPAQPPARTAPAGPQPKASGSSGGGGAPGGESRRTVLIAFGANVSIAVAKTFVGLLTGSSSMLAEAAHSWADTLNEVFLLASLSRANRPADARHPFGYGKERFFWSLLAAVGIFVTGSVFSAMEGYSALFSSHGEIKSTEYLISYVVLAFSLLMEGSSLVRAVRQLQREAKDLGRGALDHLRRSNDPSVKTVASEDSAAVVGLLLAIGGLALHQTTGSAVWEGIASFAIAVVLAYVAYALGRDNKDLLIGEAADSQLRIELLHELQGATGVDEVAELLTMQIGADDVLVAVKVDFADGLDSSDLEQLSSELERRLRANHPEVRRVYLDATPRGEVRPSAITKELDDLATPADAGPALTSPDVSSRGATRG